MPREAKFFKQDTLIQSVLCVEYSLCRERGVVCTMYHVFMSSNAKLCKD